MEQPVLQIDPAPAVPPGRWRSRALVVLVLTTGFLSLLVGMALAVVGLGFANSTACGTGAALTLTGVWLMLACKGILRRRPLTHLGLGLALAWVSLRIFMDFPAVGSAAVLFIFLLPAITLPMGLLWCTMVLVFGAVLLTRLWKNLRHREFVPLRARSLVITGSLLILLVAATLFMPQLSWQLRGRQIQELAAKYSSANRSTEKPVAFGACSMAFLGYSLMQHGAQDTRDPNKREGIIERSLADAQAELASAKAAGARYFRVGASGDQLLVPKPHQEEADDRYMTAIQRSGMKTVLVDTQHPDVCKKRKLTWPEFCTFQSNRVAYYQERYKPDVYIVVCEPMSYHGFALTRETKYSGADWASQLSGMCRLVKQKNPSTRTGICLLVMKEQEPEWEVWSRMKNLPELDILSVEIYQPQDFGFTEERLRKYGHPKETGKEFWISETYNGWALNGARRWDQDAAWLRVTRDYAETTGAEAVLVWTFGTFVPGGSFWDFGNGKLANKWQATPNLSLVGRTFHAIAASPGSAP